MRITLLILSFLLFPFAAYGEGELVTITSDDILLTEPQFTSFVKKKVPSLIEKLDSLSNTRDLLHLNVDISTFDNFYTEIEEYYSLTKELNVNIDEYSKETEQIREKVLKEKELTSPEAINLILDFKFIKKNIRYSQECLQAITEDFEILFTLLKSTPIKVNQEELNKSGLRGYTAFLVNNIAALQRGDISYKTYNTESAKKLERVKNNPIAQELAKKFDTLAIDVSGKIQLRATTKNIYSDISSKIGSILGYELYVIENKKVTPLKIIKILFGILILILIYRIIRFHIESSYNNTARGYVIKVLVRYAMYIAIIPVILYGLGLDIAKITMLVTALSVGIGFGLQKIFSNLISGIIILLDKSIKRGDTIEVENIYGVITSMRARYISVRTRDGKEYLIPNESLLVNKVINWTHSDSSLRLCIPIGISYDSDLKLAIKLCLLSIANIDRILKTPTPNCLLMGFGDSSVNLEVRAWIGDPERGIENVTSEVLLAIWDTFKKHSISIPFPQRDIHVKTLSSQITQGIDGLPSFKQTSQAQAEGDALSDATEQNSSNS